MQISSSQNLPIHKYTIQILQTLSIHSSLIISGYTGCGKSTQLPQILYNDNIQNKILILVPRKIIGYTLVNRIKQQIDQKYKDKVTVWNDQNQENVFQKFNIVFVSYMVFNNIVINKGKLQADYILFDQVHQRTNQMDKAMVMVKKLVNQQIINNNNNNNNNINNNNKKNRKNNSNIYKNDSNINKNIKNIQKHPKIIIMSATINVNLFSEYWSTHIHTNELNYINFKNDQIIQQQLHKKKLNYIKNQQDEQDQLSSKSYQINRSYVKRLNPLNSLNSVIKNKSNKCLQQQQNSDYLNAPIINIEGLTNYQITDLFIDKVLQYWPDEDNNNKKMNKMMKYSSSNNNKFVQYQLKDKQIEISRYYYQKAIQIIKYYQQNSSLQSHDTLVFLPGLAEIQEMKQMLIRSLQLSTSFSDQQLCQQQQRIIIIHSQYIQGLQQRLFTSSIHNKIFLSTDMIQSSITLPNCTLMIDFCLQRKISNNNGILKLQTQLASKSNLIQRRGRIGRNMNGICIRMINEKLYQKLDDYQMPEIQKCSLGRTILQLKNGHNMFYNPYEFLVNVVQPPKINKINHTIKELLKYGALNYNDQALKSNNKILSKQKFSTSLQRIQYKGKLLQITQTGKFFTKLECEQFLSNIILNSYKYQISNIGILIVSILSLQGRIFLKIDKRQNIQTNIDAMIKYDSKYQQYNKKNCHNDFLMIIAMFQDWRKMFFEKYLDNEKRKKINQIKDKIYEKNQSINHKYIDKQQKSKKYVSKQQKSHKQKLLQQRISQINKQYKYSACRANPFILRQINSFTYRSSEQRQFCNKIGLSSKTMRQILRISESLKLSLKRSGYYVEQYSSKQYESNQLINLKVKLLLFNSFMENSFQVKCRFISLLEQKEKKDKQRIESNTRYGHLGKSKEERQERQENNRLKQKQQDEQEENQLNQQNQQNNQNENSSLNQSKRSKIIYTKSQQYLPFPKVYKFKQQIYKFLKSFISVQDQKIPDINNTYKKRSHEKKNLPYYFKLTQCQMMKFLLPICYRFRNSKGKKIKLTLSSQIFRDILQNNDNFPLQIIQSISCAISLNYTNKYSLLYNNHNKFSSSQMIIGNDSINQIIPMEQNQQYSYIIASSIVQLNNSNKKIIPMSCYYMSIEFVLLKIVFSKYLKFSVNYEKEYVTDLYIDDYQHIKLQFYLLRVDVGRIIKLRQLIHGKEDENINININVNKNINEILDQYKGFIDQMFVLMKSLKQKAINKKDKKIQKYYLQKIKGITIIPNFSIKKKAKPNSNIITNVKSKKPSQQILIIDKFSSTSTFQLLIHQQYPLKYIEQIKSQTFRLIYLMDDQIKNLTTNKQKIQKILNNKFKQNYKIKLLRQCEVVRKFLDGQIKVDIQINYQNKQILTDFLNFNIEQIIKNQNGKKQYVFKKQFKQLVNPYNIWNKTTRTIQKDYFNEKGLKMLVKYINDKICEKQQDIQIELQQIYSQIEKISQQACILCKQICPFCQILQGQAKSKYQNDIKLYVQKTNKDFISMFSKDEYSYKHNIQQFKQHKQSYSYFLQLIQSRNLSKTIEQRKQYTLRQQQKLIFSLKKLKYQLLQKKIQIELKFELISKYVIGHYEKHLKEINQILENDEQKEYQEYMRSMMNRKRFGRY